MPIHNFFCITLYKKARVRFFMYITCHTLLSRASYIRECIRKIILCHWRGIKYECSQSLIVFTLYFGESATVVILLHYKFSKFSGVSCLWIFKLISVGFFSWNRNHTILSTLTFLRLVCSCFCLYLYIHSNGFNVKW